MYKRRSSKGKRKDLGFRSAATVLGEIQGVPKTPLMAASSSPPLRIESPMIMPGIPRPPPPPPMRLATPFNKRKAKPAPANNIPFYTKGKSPVWGQSGGGLAGLDPMSVTLNSTAPAVVATPQSASLPTVFGPKAWGGTAKKWKYSRKGTRNIKFGPERMHMRGHQISKKTAMEGFNRFYRDNPRGAKVDISRKAKRTNKGWAYYYHPNQYDYPGLGGR